MALLLTKETGGGSASANTYASVADGDSYHEGHLYASAWTGADTAQKGAALVMATRLIDAQFQFNGFRAHREQALQWPRERCPEPDQGGPSVTVLGWVSNHFVEPDLVPAAVVRATCELARELLVGDRTAAAPGEGLGSEHTSHYVNSGGVITSESASKAYSKSDTRPIIAPVARAMLSKYGALIQGGSGSVRLVRA